MLPNKTVWNKKERLNPTVVVLKLRPVIRFDTLPHVSIQP